jgi:hypothetical protein
MTADMTTDITANLRQLAGWRDSGAHPEWAYSSIEQICLEHGVVTSSLPNVSLPDVGISVDVGQSKECFLNAYRVAMDNPDLLYTEGYALWTGLTLEHAWLTHRTTGQIIDPTWAGITSRFGVHESPYLGVRFDIRFVVERANITDQPAVMFGHSRANREVIVKGLRFEDGVAVGLRD